MSLKNRFIQTLLTLFFSLAPLAYADKNENKNVDTTTDWTSIDYVLYGALVAAIVLFVMSVMKKPDDIF